MSSSANSSPPTQATANGSDAETLKWDSFDQRLTELRGQARTLRYSYKLNLDSNPCPSVGLVTELKSLADDVTGEFSSWCSKSLARVKELKNASQGEDGSKELTEYLNRKDLEEDPVESMRQALPLISKDLGLTKDELLKRTKTDLCDELRGGFWPKAITQGVVQEVLTSTADPISRAATFELGWYTGVQNRPNIYDQIDTDDRRAFCSGVDALCAKSRLDSTQMTIPRKGGDPNSGSTTARMATESQGSRDQQPSLDLERLIGQAKTTMDQYKKDRSGTRYENVNTAHDFEKEPCPYPDTVWKQDDNDFWNSDWDLFRFPSHWSVHDMTNPLRRWSVHDMYQDPPRKASQ